jgi:pyridoxal phosphate enzyme (YggS family)
LDPDRLREAIARSRELLDEAARRGGRSADDVELLLAGKYISPDEVGAVLEAGVRRLGENRLQDMLSKTTASRGRLEFDFIGHLQRRKVRDVLPMVRLIHTVDSARLAAEIAKRAEGPVRVLVEVNIGEEESKAGIVPGDLDRFVDEVSEHGNLVIGGLMSMPPLTTDPESSRPFFAATRELSRRLSETSDARHDFGDLSMGTSQDYLVAAQEGATLVRVGRGLIEQAREE